MRKLIPSPCPEYPDAEEDIVKLQELEQSVQSLEDEKERLNKITPEQLDNLQPRFKAGVLEKIKICERCLLNSSKILEDFKSFLVHEKYKQWNSIKCSTELNQAEDSRTVLQTLILTDPNSLHGVTSSITSIDTPPKPVADIPSKPATENTSKPAADIPSKLAAKIDSKPSTENPPSKPAADIPSKPVTDISPKPVTDIPSKPSKDISSKPAADIPSKPAADVPSKPAADIPSKPAVDIPSKPAADVPSKPSKDTPSKPAADVPSKPAADIPSKPAADVPSKPAADIPSKPAVDIPSKPAVDIPSKPSKDTPSKPAADIPSKPAADIPSKPVADITSKPAADIPSKPIAIISIDTPLTPSITTPSLPRAESAVGVGVETSIIESRPTVTIVTTVTLEKESDLQLNTENLSNINPKESMNPIPCSSSRSLLDKPTNLQLLTSEEPGTRVPDTRDEGGFQQSKGIKRKLYIEESHNEYLAIKKSRQEAALRSRLKKKSVLSKSSCPQKFFHLKCQFFNAEQCNIFCKVDRVYSSWYELLGHMFLFHRTEILNRTLKTENKIELVCPYNHPVSGLYCAAGYKLVRKLDEEVKDDAGFDVHFALALFDLQKHIEGWHIPEYRNEKCPRCHVYPVMNGNVRKMESWQLINFWSHQAIHLPEYQDRPDWITLSSPPVCSPTRGPIGCWYGCNFCFSSGLDAVLHLYQVHLDELLSIEGVEKKRKIYCPSFSGCRFNLEFMDRRGNEEMVVGSALSSLYSHLNLHHCLEETRLLICPTCGLDLAAYQNLQIWDHLSQHNIVKQAWCSHCSRYVDRLQVDLHVRTDCMAEDYQKFKYISVLDSQCDTEVAQISDYVRRKEEQELKVINAAVTAHNQRLTGGVNHVEEPSYNLPAECEAERLQISKEFPLSSNKDADKEASSMRASADNNIDDDDDIIILTPEEYGRTSKPRSSPDDELDRQGFTLSRVEKIKIGLDIYPLFNQTTQDIQGFKEIAVILENKIFYGGGETKMKAREDLLKNVNEGKEGQRTNILTEGVDVSEKVLMNPDDYCSKLEKMKGNKKYLKGLIEREKFIEDKYKLNLNGSMYTQYSKYLGSEQGYALLVIDGTRLVSGQGRTLKECRRQIINKWKDVVPAGEICLDLQPRDPRFLKLMSSLNYKRMPEEGFHFGGERISLWGQFSEQSFNLSGIVQKRLYFATGSTKEDAIGNIVDKILAKKSSDIYLELERHDINNREEVKESEIKKKPELSVEEKLTADGFHLKNGENVELEASTYPVWYNGNHIAVVINDIPYYGTGRSVKECRAAVVWSYLTTRVGRICGEEEKSPNVSVVMKNLEQIKNLGREKGPEQYLVQLGFRISQYFVLVDQIKYILWVPRQTKDIIISIATVCQSMPLIVKYKSRVGAEEKLKALISLKHFLNPEMKPGKYENLQDKAEVREPRSEEHKTSGGGKPGVRYHGVGQFLSQLKATIDSDPEFITSNIVKLDESQPPPLSEASNVDECKDVNEVIAELLGEGIPKNCKRKQGKRKNRSVVKHIENIEPCSRVSLNTLAQIEKGLEEKGLEEKGLEEKGLEEKGLEEGEIQVTEMKDDSEKIIDKEALMNRRLKFVQENHPNLTKPNQSSPNWFQQLQLNLQRHKYGSSSLLSLPANSSSQTELTEDQFQYKLDQMITSESSESNVDEKPVPEKTTEEGSNKNLTSQLFKVLNRSPTEKDISLLKGIIGERFQIEGGKNDWFKSTQTKPEVYGIANQVIGYRRSKEERRSEEMEVGKVLLRKRKMNLNAVSLRKMKEKKDLFKMKLLIITDRMKSKGLPLTPATQAKFDQVFKNKPKVESMIRKKIIDQKEEKKKIKSRQKKKRQRARKAELMLKEINSLTEKSKEKENWQNKKSVRMKIETRDSNKLEFEQPDSLEHSSYEERNEKKFTCTECGTSFSKQKILNIHKQIHAEI